MMIFPPRHVGAQSERRVGDERGRHRKTCVAGNVSARMPLHNRVGTMGCVSGKRHVPARIRASHAAGLGGGVKSTRVRTRLPTTRADSRVDIHMPVRAVTQDEVVTRTGGPQKRREPQPQEKALGPCSAHGLL